MGRKFYEINCALCSPWFLRRLPCHIAALGGLKKKKTMDGAREHSFFVNLAMGTFCRL